MHINFVNFVFELYFRYKIEILLWPNLNVYVCKLLPKDLNSHLYSLHLISTYTYTTLLVFELLKPSRLVTYVVLNFCYWCGCLNYDKGCVSFKYEKLPKFVAGVNCLTHDNNDYSRWIQSKGTLREEDKKFGAWQRATHSYFF